MNEMQESIEPRVQQLEYRVEETQEEMAIVEERLQHISTTIDKLAKAGDEDVAASLDSNIREVTQAADNLQRECAALESELDRIEAMLNLLTTRNNESTSELNALAAIGEDVGKRHILS